MMENELIEKYRWLGREKRKTYVCAFESRFGKTGRHIVVSQFFLAAWSTASLS